MLNLVVWIDTETQAPIGSGHNQNLAGIILFPYLDRPTFPISPIANFFNFFLWLNTGYKFTIRKFLVISKEIFYFLFMTQCKLQIYNKELSSGLQGDYWPCLKPIMYFNFFHVTV